jgi:hypothetical protein
MVNHLGFAGGRVASVLCGHLEVLKGRVVVRLRLGGWDVADRLQQALVVKPIDLFEGLVFHRLE